MKNHIFYTGIGVLLGMKRPRNQCDLKSCFLCRHSLQAWIPPIQAHKKNLRFKKNESIFEEGQDVKGIYFLYEGRVKVHKRWGSRKELILHFSKPGDIIGYRGLGDEKVYPVTATALEPVIVCFIDLVFFETSLRANHQLTYQLMNLFANELQEAEKRMRNLAHMDVKGRLAETLLLLQKQFGKNKDGNINIQLSRQDIASYAGTTYETLFRTMSELIKEKIIRATGKHIKILKEPKLVSLLATERR